MPHHHFPLQTSSTPHSSVHSRTHSETPNTHSHAPHSLAQQEASRRGRGRGGLLQEQQVEQLRERWGSQRAQLGRVFMAGQLRLQGQLVLPRGRTQKVQCGRRGWEEWAGGRCTGGGSIDRPAGRQAEG